VSSVNLGQQAVKLPEEYKRGGECHEHNTARIVSGTSFGTGGGTHSADQNESSKGRRGMAWPESAQGFRSFVMPWRAGSRELSVAGPQEACVGFLEERGSNGLSKLARSCR